MNLPQSRSLGPRCAALAWVVASLLLPTANAADPAPVVTPPETISPQALQQMLPELRKGGYVLYFRHAATRLDQQDQQPITLEDCATQRNLSDEGRDQAEAIGAAFKQAGIPVGQVLSSPFCRCLDTARIAFAKSQTSQALYFAIGLSKPERQAKGDALRALLSQAPTPGTNHVIVAHTANLEEAAGYWPKPEGTAILFRPDGKGGFSALGRIPPETWPQLASGAAAR
jgi:phosphohistidine phosphatase SixA